MSRIYVDELVSKNGLDYVTFVEGLKVNPTQVLDLDGAGINLSTGLGLNNQLLASTGSGLKWVTFADTDTTYEFGATGAALNDVRLNLTAGGSGTGTDQVILQGSGDTTVSLANNVITISSTDADTTYDLGVGSVVDGVTISLSGSDSTVDTVTLKEGSNISITRVGNEITVETLLSGTVAGPVSTTAGAIALFDGTDGTLLSNSTLIVDGSGNLETQGSLTVGGAITAPPETASLITFWYDQTGSFPNANAYEGAVAYSDNNNALFYASGNSWYQLAKLSDIQVNTDTTYSYALTGTGLGQLTLSDSNGLTDDVFFRRNTYGSIELIRSDENLYFDGRLYSISSEVGTGNNVKFRLTGRNHDTSGAVTTTVTDDVIFAGADGLLVERTDENTITFRAPSLSVTQYTDAQAKDAAAQSITNGTHVGISFTYDSVNKILSSVVTGGTGEGGTPILYDFYGTNTTSNQVILNLDPSDGITDTVEFAGGGGTTVSWNSVDKKATIQSTAPVNADCNATTGLAQILNKPTIPAAYTLPTATTSILGGIKIDGSTILIDGNGVISAAPGGYVLPAATETTLGGIKIGAGLEIDVNGVVNVTDGGGGGTVVTRQQLSSTTSTSLAANETAELNIVGYKAYTLLKIETSAESWVRVYTNDTSRDADQTRSEGTDPSVGSGVIAEVRSGGAETILISPGVIGYNDDPTPNSTIYTSVTNRSGSTTPITVTLTAIRLEA